MIGPLRVGIAGCGISGAAAGILLARDGHEVTLLESEADPRGVGAGLWLQRCGQQVVQRLGLLEDLAARSRPVDRIDACTPTGHRVMDLSYGAVAGAPPALGVHRGELFLLLLEALRATPARLETAVTVTGARPGAGGTLLQTPQGTLGPFDLVIGADGSRSPVRASLHVTVRDHPYRYGALWAVMPDPDRVTGRSLYQCLDGTRRYLGVLPTGLDHASIFWSATVADMPRYAGARGVRVWRERALRLAGAYAPLVETVTELLPATYRDVVVRTPYRVSGASAAVLVGDAAHAMSPQLGAGTSLALADVWSLARALRAAPDLGSALAAYARDRRAHVRWYSWWTRLMMPVFQSGLTPLAWPRDLLGAPVGRIAPIERHLVHTLLGDRTSLGSAWSAEAACAPSGAQSS